MQRAIPARTAQVGELIVTKLVKGKVHEAFRHLKVWYREASETQVRPCFQTMERQTVERVELYRRRNPPGLPIIVNHAEMENSSRGRRADQWPQRGSVTDAGRAPERVAQRGKVGGGPKEGAAIASARDDWKALVKLVQAVWDEGKIPTQLGWVVTVLIPKGGGDYCGIDLLEPI